MNKHRKNDQIDDNHLVVTVTSACYSGFVASSTGWPRLVIDYGGAALVLDVVDLREAESFGLELARASLDFAIQCRFLMQQSHQS